MDVVTVTVSCSSAEPFDVELPLDLTPAEVVARLAAHNDLPAGFGAPGTPFSLCLVALDRLLAPDRPLREGGVLEGDLLELRNGPPPGRDPRGCPPVAVNSPSLQVTANCRLLVCPGNDNRIGRDTGDIRLGGLSGGQFVSAHHARLYSQRGRWWIEDLGSSNGTTLDGAPLSPKTAADLRHGARLQLGGPQGPTLVFLLPIAP